MVSAWSTAASQSTASTADELTGVSVITTGTEPFGDLDFFSELIRFSRLGVDAPDASALPPLITGEPMNSLRSPVKPSRYDQFLFDFEDIKNDLRLTCLLLLRRSAFTSQSPSTPCRAADASRSRTQRWRRLWPFRITDGNNNRNITDKIQ